MRLDNRSKEEKAMEGRMDQRGEKGMALLFAIIISLFLIVLGLGLTMFSLKNFSIGNESESHTRAFAVADGGFSLMKDSLRGQDLTVLLGTYNTVPEYIEINHAASDTAPLRDPIYPVDARNIDYRNPPEPVGYIRIPGLLTPVSGSPMGSGYFFARISDNLDGDNDPEIDSDHTIFLRVTGVHPGPLAEIASHGGTVKNSVTTIEGMLKRDLSFDLGAPLSISGPDVDITFSGASFNIDGDNDHPGISVLNDDAAGNGAAQSAQSIYDSLLSNQNMGRRIKGAEGDFGSFPQPSIRDDTYATKNSPNPDARNVLDPNFLASFIQNLSVAADTKYEGETTLSGSNIELGTAESPAITFVDGNLSVAGNGDGYGVLVVTGSLDYQGAFDFNGLVLVLGEGDVKLGGATKDITGGMLVGKLVSLDGGGYEMGITSVTIAGNSNFIFDSDSIRMAISLLPLKTIMWREITPDIEPSVSDELAAGGG